MDADPRIANEVQPTKTMAELVRMDQRVEGEFSQLTLPEVMSDILGWLNPHT